MYTQPIDKQIEADLKEALWRIGLCKSLSHELTVAKFHIERALNIHNERLK
jgi:hypothetical protein